MNLLDFFKGTGTWLWRTFGIIKKVVPEEYLTLAIGLAKSAAMKFVDNQARRDWAVAELMKIPGMRESVARLLVELAIQHLKEDVLASNNFVKVAGAGGGGGVSQGLLGRSDEIAPVDHIDSQMLADIARRQTHTA